MAAHITEASNLAAWQYQNPRDMGQETDRRGIGTLLPILPLDCGVGSVGYVKRIVLGPASAEAAEISSC
jgi:hypothetical protein